MKTRPLTLALVLTTMIGVVATAAEVPKTSGTIARITVYRGQALITRTISLDLPAGTSELIVTQLPHKILPESLYAQANGTIKVLSVRYRERAVKKDTRKEVRELDAQIEDIKLKQYQNERDREIVDWLFHRFEGQWKLLIDATNVELNRSVLQFKPLEQLTGYLEAKAIQWHDKNVELAFTRDKLQKELDLLQRRRESLSGGRSRTEREAILFVTSASKANAEIELSYLVKDANWLPQYNLRGRPNESTVLVEYNAIVHQSSGENWDGVNLALSTADPMMVAAAPTLDPMAVTLTSGSGASFLESLQLPSSSTPARRQHEAQTDQAQLLDLDQEFKQMVEARLRQSKRGKAAQIELNRYALSNQLLSFNIAGTYFQRLQEQAAQVARTEGVSVTYDLPGRLSLPSRSDQQLVTIAVITCPADFALIATPLLTDYVYLQAQLVNGSDTVLLPGSASMFRNGEFVGQTDLPLVTIGEAFTGGFGIDSQVQVTRELAHKRTRIQGGNRIDTYNYRITLENYKDALVKLRLLDRLPLTESSSIKIDLNKTSGPLSEDATYLRTVKDQGILRWDLNLEPNTIGAQATAVTYSFTMEYDKNMQIQVDRSAP